MQFDISKPMSGENMAPPIAVLHTTLISSDTELRDIEPSAAAADDLRSTIEEKFGSNQSRDRPPMNERIKSLQTHRRRVDLMHRTPSASHTRETMYHSAEGAIRMTIMVVSNTLGMSRVVNCEYLYILGNI